MKKVIALWLTTAFVLSYYVYSLNSTPPAYAQSMPTNSLKTTPSQNNTVTVSSSFSVGLSNQTIKIKDGMLRSAVIGFLTSGPNVLKMSPTDQPVVRTKIVNQISNATQSVQGVEATNAIVGVELSKALKILVGSTTKPNQSVVVTIETSSTCKPLGSMVTCDNTVNIQ
jgi:hypothetical protein